MGRGNDGEPQEIRGTPSELGETSLATGVTDKAFSLEDVWSVRSGQQGCTTCCEGGKITYIMPTLQGSLCGRAGF